MNENAETDGGEGSKKNNINSWRWIYKRKGIKEVKGVNVREEVKKGGSDVNWKPPSLLILCNHVKRNIFLQEVIYFRNSTDSTSTLETSKTPRQGWGMASSTKQRASNKPLIYVSELPEANSRLQAKQRRRASLETVHAIYFTLNLTFCITSAFWEAEAEDAFDSPVLFHNKVLVN